MYCMPEEGVQLNQHDKLLNAREIDQVEAEKHSTINTPSITQPPLIC